MSTTTAKSARLLSDGWDPAMPWPRRASSWWVKWEALRWPEISIRDAIRQRADRFAEAGIDLALIFGTHCRFDFINHFGTLHGYLADVADALHERGIKVWDHYTCTIVERPRTRADYDWLARSNRHHVLLVPDLQARPHLQYEGHRLDDLRTIDIRDSRPVYIPKYATEGFCQNNPAFLEMNVSYLRRLMSEVDFDGFQIDDMCDYGGLISCACRYCRERFRADYGHELPEWEDKDFWGEQGFDDANPYVGGNYANPAFRDWLRMRVETITDHVGLLREVVGDKPLMTCCSSTGPMHLNLVALDLETMSPHLNAFMLENCGIGPGTLDWSRMDAEALQQKDIARGRGDAPAMALSYTIFEDGAKLGWGLARFWGVPNWSSTLDRRLEVDPPQPLEITETLAPLHAWEDQMSPLSLQGARDIVEVRLVNNRLNKDLGWLDADGRAHWDHVREWSMALTAAGVGYRILRSGELADADRLTTGDPEAGDLERTPIVLDGMGAVSDEQHAAVRQALQAGRPVWLTLPYGTHDAHGLEREQPLSDDLQALGSESLVVLDPASTPAERLAGLVADGRFAPCITVHTPDTGWALRLRRHPEGVALHLANLTLSGTVHPTLKEMGLNDILETISSANPTTGMQVTVTLPDGPDWASPVLLSPDFDGPRTVGCDAGRLTFDLTGTTFYAVCHHSLQEES